MSNLKELYDSGINIMEYIRKQNSTDENSVNAILASYDMQAGSYINAVLDESLSDKYHINSVRTPMSRAKYTQLFTDELAKEFDKYDYKSVLEAGVGEATTFSYLLKKLKNKDVIAKGFDISPSRIKVAKEFAQSQNISKSKPFVGELFVGDLQKIPFKDNSFDIVYTVHAVEPNTNNEKTIVEELYRICNKYLILVEPSYELGNAETKANIENHKYIRNLKKTVDELGYKVLKHELFPIGTYTNQPAIFVIEKLNNNVLSDKVDFACPVCKSDLKTHEGNYFCSECNLVYPVLSDVPILDVNRAIFFSKYI